MMLPRRRLLLLSARHRIGRCDGHEPLADDGWIATIRAPEGLTVIRRARPVEPENDCWAAFYGDDAHALDMPGMLAAVIGPLAVDGVPVFVASTIESDFVFVPWEQRERATAILTSAGHQIRDDPAP